MRNTRRSHRYLTLATMLLAGIGALASGGCQTGNPENDPDALDSAAAPKEITIVKGEPGKDYPDAKLTVITPAADEVVTGDSVMVKVELSGFDLAAPTEGEQSKGIAYSADGQHIHVIIDDKPYMAMYTPEGFSVGKLSAGAHTLRAFPSRSWHESVKSPNAFVAHTFYVTKKAGDPVLKAGEPLLTYSRPKGEYKGRDARRVMIDFYLSNAKLGAGAFSVVVSIDGQVKDTITEWVPHFIEGLPDGEHTVKLELVGPDGKVVPGVFNSVEGRIKIAHDEAPAAPMTHDSGTAGPDSASAAHAPGTPTDSSKPAK